MFCLKCGMSLNDGAKFCPNCGAAVGAAANNAAPVADTDFANDEQTVFAAPNPQPVPPVQQSQQQFVPPVQQSQQQFVPPVQQPLQQFVPPVQQSQQQFVPPVQQSQQQYIPPVQQPVPEYPSGQYQQTAVKSSNAMRNVIIIVVVLVLAVVGTFVGLFATGVIGGSDNPDKLYEIAERYLDEEDYEEAIVRFEKMLEIEDLSVDDIIRAYLGLAEAYEAQDEIDKAIDVLEDGIEVLEDNDDADEKDIKKLQNKLDKLNDSGDKDDEAATDESGKDKDEDNTTAAKTTAEPVAEPDPVQMFDVSTINGNWGSTSDNAYVIISDFSIEIDVNDHSTVYYSWNATETGFEAGGYTFVYDKSRSELKMNGNGTAATLSYGTEKPVLPKEGKVLNIRCWNDEFKQRMTQFYPGYVDVSYNEGKIGDVKVKWITEPNADSNYQTMLDYALISQDSKAADEKIDIFLIEADYADKYVNSDYSLPVSNLGITDADTAEMYRYTKDVATDSNGVLKAVSWQACPGLFAYRRSIAMDVLGTDDPAIVQQYLSTWDKFDDTAAAMKDKGYKMLSGYDDAYRVFSNNMTGPWVVDDVLMLDSSLEKWVEMTKSFTDNGYNNRNGMWSEGWAKDQSADGNVFGFFYSTWGINLTLLGNAGSKGYGDWAVCEGPQSFFWGGTWLCAGYQTDNPTLVHDIMYNMTCNGEIMEQMTRDPAVQDYTNNMAAMQRIADDKNYRSDFLGGQNHIALFTESAKKIDMSNITKYDQELNNMFQSYFKNYFDGNCTYDEALTDFYYAAIAKFPNLS